MKKVQKVYRQFTTWWMCACEHRSVFQYLSFIWPINKNKETLKINFTPFHWQNTLLHHLHTVQNAIILCVAFTFTYSTRVSPMSDYSKFYKHMLCASSCASLSLSLNTILFDWIQSYLIEYNLIESNIILLNQTQSY